MKLRKFKTPRWVWVIWFFICHWVDPKDASKSIKFRIKIGQSNPDLSPKRCIKCGHNNFDEFDHTFLDSYGGTILEYKSKCVNCGTINGYWAHGSWMP